LWRNEQDSKEKEKAKKERQIKSCKSQAEIKDDTTSNGIDEGDETQDDEPIKKRARKRDS